jgi:flagellar hook-associated protein 3 FlgL
MTTSRVGSLSLVNDVLRDVGSSQVKLAELQNQISSGYKSRNFAGLNGSVEQFTQVESQISRATQYNRNNQLNITKLQTVDVALGKITDIADKIKNTIIGANGAVVQSSNLPQIVADLLTAMGNELNASFNGAYIFSGTDTLSQPVPSTDASNTAVGVQDDNYYVGSKEDATLRIDDRTEVTFPARADNIAFQKIYAAAKQAITAVTNNDASQLQAAQQLIQSGQQDLIKLRSQVGSTVANIESADARLKDLGTYWQQLSDGISKTDVVAASTQVAGYQSILQASYQVYARLSQLRLSDFLR